MNHLHLRSTGGRGLALRAGVLGVLALLSPAAGRAGALTDGSVGAVQALSGRFTVPQSLGTLRGANLFHSFQRFGVERGESATFTTATPLQNVIARVTGGVPSSVDGPLRLDAAGGGQPNFFLINPAGITFGAGGSVDVPGALHLSTANRLQFADGAVVDTDLGRGSSLSAAAPAAFGFIGRSSGAVVLQPGAAVGVGFGQALSLNGADLAIGTNLLTLGGPLRLAAVGTEAAEVGLSGPLPTLGGRLVVEGGALVGSFNLRPLDAGEVAVSAGDIVIGSAVDDGGSALLSVASGADVGGAVRVQAARSLTLRGGGKITSSTDQAGAGAGGAVEVRVGGVLTVGGGSGIATLTTGAGPAGALGVVAGGAIVLDGGGTPFGAAIGSETFGSGAAGAVSVTSGGGLLLARGGKISSSSFGAGRAGALAVTATSVTLDHQGAPGGTFIASNANGLGDAGSVLVRVSGAVSVLSGGAISSSTTAAGQAGMVTVQARSVLLAGQGAATGILSETTGAGQAGGVNVQAEADIVVRDAARISSSSFQSGNAGAVVVGAASLLIADAQPGPNASGVFSIARGAGQAGTIDVNTSGLLSITDGAVSTSTFGTGRGGAVTVNAGRIVIANSGALGGAGISANTAGRGDAGSLSVTAAESIEVLNGASISSSTFGAGAGGGVRVSANSLRMDGRGSAFDTAIVSESFGSGAAGAVQVQVRDRLSILQQATISSSAYASGRGGLVRVQAGEAVLDNTGGTRRTGIGSVAFSGSGDAGNVEVEVSGALAVLNGAEISANTATLGAAGTVHVRADTLSLAGQGSINSGATAGSGGRTGDVVVEVGRSLSLTDARLSIENDATVARPDALPASTLSVNAGRIALTRSEITASATGNIAAGRIVVEAGEALHARERSAINTSAVTGGGGSIVVRNAGVLLLDHSRITTSVTGSTQGDGGPITLQSPVVVLNSGFVQANTAVASARGGDVALNAATPGVLIASGQRLVSGGLPVRYGPASEGLNVIQAARPDGVNGDLRIDSPLVDLAGSLAPLGSPRVGFETLGADVCSVGEGSSLTPVGRGALRPSFAQRVRPTP